MAEDSELVGVGDKAVIVGVYWGFFIYERIRKNSEEFQGKDMVCISSSKRYEILNLSIISQLVSCEALWYSLMKFCI